MTEKGMKKEVRGLTPKRMGCVRLPKVLLLHALLGWLAVYESG